MSSPGAVAALLDVDVHQGLDALQTRGTGCPRRQRNGRDLQVLLRRVQTVLVNFLWPPNAACAGKGGLDEGLLLQQGG